MYEPNIVELATIKYRILSILPFSSLVSVATLISYLAFRVKYTIVAATANDSRSAILNSCLYFISELGLLRKLSPWKESPFGYANHY